MRANFDFVLWKLSLPSIRMKYIIGFSHICLITSKGLKVERKMVLVGSVTFV